MATDNKERYLKQIADELHQMNKVLDRMCQAPIFCKEDGFRVVMQEVDPVLYICDGNACNVCYGAPCQHTSKIEHAAHFTKDGDAYVEKYSQE